MKRFPFPLGATDPGRVIALLMLLVPPGQAHAQPTILSTIPASGATGVSPSAAVIIAFSEAMDTSMTTADFIATNPYAEVPTALTWSAGNTVLTCTPMPSFPASRGILWSASGQDGSGRQLTGITGGNFTTGSGNQLTLTNVLWNGGHFACDVISPAGQTLTVEYNSTLRSNQWQTLLTTNSPAGRVHVTDPQSGTSANRFYRARTGS